MSNRPVCLTPPDVVNSWGTFHKRVKNDLPTTLTSSLSRDLSATMKTGWLGGVRSRPFSFFFLFVHLNRKMIRMTTRAEFAKADKTFQKACELAGIKPTKRQAGKWLRGIGIARTFMKEAKENAKG